MQYFEQRRQELEKKECQLKESLIRFEKFFKENDEKKARALKKLSQERSLQKQRVKEIENLTAEMRILEQKRDKLERVVKSYAKYRDFLVAVLKESEDFSEIPELIHRYDALTANLEDLKARERLNNQQYEQLDGDLRRYREVTYDEKLTLTNELVGMRNKLERYQTKIRQKEQTWEHAREAAVNRISELCTIKAATQNMYKIARTYEKYGEEAHADDVTSQLRIIGDFIVDLVEVTKTLSPRMKEK
ncbi:putative filamin-A-interacting protein 1 (FILIP) [Fasciola hepatica]|uniref:Filamin-A-interacting protein 1 (FILIP) n=1 Tax=Fasciola hepatica TaxID=6192 RepID=A0A4E0RIU8_FASHE|nr:putative filamin-A-interacting protein 1 (FILIP) [Fasciola hepatica]